MLHWYQITRRYAVTNELTMYYIIEEVAGDEEMMAMQEDLVRGMEPTRAAIMEVAESIVTMFSNPAYARVAAEVPTTSDPSEIAGLHEILLDTVGQQVQVLQAQTQRYWKPIGWVQMVLIIMIIIMTNYNISMRMYISHVTLACWMCFYCSLNLLIISISLLILIEPRWSMRM